MKRLWIMLMVALLAGTVLMALVGGSWEISDLLGQGDRITADSQYLPILFLILLAAFTKSAQFPFHLWLPHAMAAPTPVSALLHAVAVVKAGVFTILKIVIFIFNI